MPVLEEKPIYVRGKVTKPQKQAVSKRCQALDITESQFVRRCIREHFERYSKDGIVWPVSEQDSEAQK